MPEQIPTVLLICALVLLADWYLIGGIRTSLKKWKFAQKRSFTITYWTVSIVFVIGIFIGAFLKLGLGFQAAIMLGFFLLVISKALFLPFMVIDDVRRLLIWIKQKKEPVKAQKLPGPPIPRSDFLMKAGLLAGAVPLAGIAYGTVNGVYDYKIKHRTLYLPNLPKAFDGITLGQISDIHSGSFYNKKAVAGGVDLLLKEKPDIIFFTGDLVNSRSNEMYDY
ncbi:MAG: metallophosphoesterase, partial [Mucilaginibacter sp.]